MLVEYYRKNVTRKDGQNLEGVDGATVLEALNRHAMEYLLNERTPVCAIENSLALFRRHLFLKKPFDGRVRELAGCRLKQDCYLPYRGGCKIFKKSWECVKDGLRTGTGRMN